MKRHVRYGKYNFFLCGMKVPEGYKQDQDESLCGACNQNVKVLLGNAFKVVENKFQRKLKKWKECSE